MANQCPLPPFVSTNDSGLQVGAWVGVGGLENGGKKWGLILIHITEGRHPGWTKWCSSSYIVVVVGGECEGNDRSTNSFGSLMESEEVLKYANVITKSRSQLASWFWIFLCLTYIKSNVM